MTTNGNADPMFQQLKAMFPNLDGSVLYSVWQANNKAIDATIDALLSFNDIYSPPSSTSSRAQVPETNRPPTLETTLTQRENAEYLLTPSGVIDPVNNKYFGDYIRQMQSKKKKKKSRGRRGATGAIASAATTTTTTSSISPAPAVTKKTRWIPLEEYATAKRQDEWTQVTHKKKKSSRNTRRRKAKKAVGVAATAATPAEVQPDVELKIENPFGPLETLLRANEEEEQAQVRAFGSAPTDEELQPLLFGEPIVLSTFSASLQNGNELNAEEGEEEPEEAEVSESSCGSVEEPAAVLEDGGAIDVEDNAGELDDMRSSVIERGLASYAWSMDDSYVWVSGSVDDFAAAETVKHNDEEAKEDEEWRDDFVDDFGNDGQSVSYPETQLDADLVESLAFADLNLANEEAVALTIDDFDCPPSVELLPSSTVAPPSALPLAQAWTCGASASDRIVVKLYLDEGNIHRFSLERGQLSFERLQERVAHNLLQRADSPAECRAYAVTYEDEEGDRIAVCSQEELCEALRVHEECLWPAMPAGEQPILRLHVRPVALGPASLSHGYIIA